ncbi:MAG: hypothetical protein LUH03_09990 [Oscillospiraceae bacterium]|nr:hypothetical protein [Oscillospiraceae bacterium]
MNLVTGYRGTKHVTSADMAAFNRVIFGDGDYVIQTGDCLAASYSDTNILRISDGEMLIQGHHARIEVGDYVEVTLTDGTSGTYRKDYIVAEYVKASDGTESVTIKDIVGEEASSASAATLPTLTMEDLTQYGDTRQVALYTVTFSGLSAGDPVQVFSTVKDLQTQIGDVNDTLTTKINSVNTSLTTLINAKQATITGAATTVTTSNLTASRALVSNSSGKIAVSSATLTELSYLSGLTGKVQTQLDKFTTWANKIGRYYDTASAVSLASSWSYSYLKLVNGTLSASGGNTSSTVSGGYWIAPFSCFVVAVALVTFSASSSGSRAVRLARLDSSDNATGTLGEVKIPGINHEQQISVSGAESMSSGDKLAIRVAQDSGKSLTVSGTIRILIIPNL